MELSMGYFELLSSIVRDVTIGYVNNVAQQRTS